MVASDDGLLYALSMLTDPDFVVTEAGMRACVETIHSLHQALAVAQAQIEALGEAMVVLGANVELLQEHARSQPAHDA